MQNISPQSPSSLSSVPNASTIHLIVGPAISGKTETALNILQAHHGKAIVLVPNIFQHQYIKQRISQLNQNYTFARIRARVYQFDTLARRIMKSGGYQPAALQRVAQTMLLRGIIQNLAANDRLPIFHTIATTSGFIDTLAAFLADARDAMLAPHALHKANVTPYDTEVAVMYQTFCDDMERLSMADMQARLLLARDTLLNTPDVLADVRLLVVDGFDQFTPLQMEMLRILTQRIPQSIITLTGSTSRRLAHRRFVRTYDQIVEHLRPTEYNMLGPGAGQSSIPIPDHLLHDPVAAPLRHIETYLFELDTPAPIDAQNTLTVIEAADREREVRAVLRHVKHLVDQATPPSEIAILFRSGTIYGHILREIAAEYTLSLALYEGMPLNEAPAAVAFMNLLRLPLHNYPRRVLVDVWHSFADRRLYVNLASLTPDDTHNPLLLLASPPEIERAASILDIIARQAGVTTGLHRLRSAVQRAVHTSDDKQNGDSQNKNDENDEQDETMPFHTEAITILAVLDAFTAWLKPPSRALFHEYVAWVTERIARPDGSMCADNQQSYTIQAYARITRLLNEMAEASRQIHTAPISYETFVSDLQAALATTRYGRGTPTATQVAAMPVLASRGLHYDYVFLLGLGDGEFPMMSPMPPIYTRRERGLLAQEHIHVPPPDPADERTIFYEALTRARRTLTLSRTYLDERGNPIHPSPYLTAVLRLVMPETVTHVVIRAGSTPLPDEAASPQEELIARMEQVRHRGNIVARQTDDDDTYSSVVHHVSRAWTIEDSRERTSPYGPFDGVIGDSNVVSDLNQHFGAEYLWSVTRLNNYITCPFRFAAAHILNLSPRIEPEEGLQTVGRGRIYHDILAHAGSEWIAQQIRFTEEHADDIVRALQQAADTILADAPARYSFTPNHLWEWEQTDIRRRLEQALRKVLQTGGDWSAYRPVAIERGFAMRPGSVPLKLSTPHGDVLVIGRIDRIDQRDDGTLAVIDYKSGSSTRRLKDTLSGNDVQLPIYVLAVEQVIMPGHDVERASFLHLGSGVFSPPLTGRTREEALDAMYERVAETIAHVRAGLFPVRPRSNCPMGCEFASICRLNVAKRDAEGAQEG